MKVRYKVKAHAFRDALLTTIADRIEMAGQMQSMVKTRRQKDREEGAIAALTDLKRYIESWEIEP